MSKGKLFAIAAGVLATMVVALVVIIAVRRQARERELIRILEGGASMAASWCPAIEELGEMRSVRAVPAIINLWGQGGVGPASRAGVMAVAKVGAPALPHLRRVFQESKAKGMTSITLLTLNSRLLFAVMTCQEMGPAAAPLLPELRSCTQWAGQVADAI